MAHLSSLLLVLSVLAVNAGGDNDSQDSVRKRHMIVDTTQGKLEGILLQGGKEGLADVRAFLGVPYASPPIGSRRFLPPVTAPAWNGVRRANRFAPACPQRNLDEGRQNEDCLYLNVYAPQSENQEGALRSVALFIHGDSYESGSGNLHDGSVLAATQDLIVVTINFRLGVLGFLNSNVAGDSQNPANLGILDQIAALHWVHENIERFSGDPNNVSLFGHGTGAACVHFLMTSKALPEGLLFQRVGLLSGSGTAPWSISRRATDSASALGQALNCSLPHLLSCLRSKPVKELLEAAHTLPWTSKFTPQWGPSYDGVVVHSYRYNPRQYLEKMSRYDLLLGVASADATELLTDDQLTYGISAQERNMILSDFVAECYKVRQREIFSAIVTEYTDWQAPTHLPVGIRDSTLEALQDGLYTAPIVETADYHASLNSNSWFYVFDYQSKGGKFKQRQGSVHGEQLKYIFGTVLRTPDHFLPAEISLAKSVMRLWNNFFATGNPNVSRDQKEEASARIDPSAIVWSSYDTQYKKYLLIGLKPKIKNYYRAKEMALWLNLVPDLRSAGLAASAHDDHDDDTEVQGGGKAQQLDYKLYSELLPFVPSLKLLVGEDTFFSPSSSEVVLPNANSSSNGNVSTGGGILDDHSVQALSNYSTALSVTIAIGCSLLVLNVLIFAAVYYQKDRGPDSVIQHQLQKQKLFHTDSISQFVEQRRPVAASSTLQPPQQPPPPEFADSPPPPPPAAPYGRHHHQHGPVAHPRPCNGMATMPLKSSLKRTSNMQGQALDDSSRRYSNEELRV